MQSLHFDVKPSNEELRRAVKELGLSAYRFMEVSADGLHYKIQEVDVQAELARSTLTPSGDTWTVPATITCHRCGSQFKGWQVVARKWYDNKPLNINTEHCPRCPLYGLHEGLDGHHVMPKTFNILAGMFITENNIDIEQIEIHGATHKQFKDTNIAHKFLEFHREHAELELVSAAANQCECKKRCLMETNDDNPEFA